MKYPSHTDYKDAVLAPQDYFDRLKDLRPVLNGRGDPVQDSGNFAVVYKMTDGVRNYAVKCFTKEQKGRREAYRSICGYMSALPSPYMARIEYLEKELFVDGEEYPVLVMDWVEGVKLDSYVKTIRDDRAKCARLADEFRGLALWLMSQEFAHGDLKPDNIIVTEGGRLMLVDYDGMFVPSMRGQKARELGTPPYRFKGRTLRDFDEYADDYACVFILLVLVTGMFEPVDFEEFAPLADARDIVSRFAAYFENARVAPYIAAFLLVASCGRLNRQALYPLLSRRSGALESESPLPGNLVASIARAPSASDPLTFNVNGVSFEMVPVEGGTFTMGATPEQEEDAFGDEYPAHRVTLSGYAIGKYPVTQALWKAVMGSNPSCFKGSERPVERVSWEDCQVFISELNKLTGKKFRLPTEAEWEYAARGGNRSHGYKYAGSDNPDDVAWHEGNSADKTHPVGMKKPNELGVYDMSGNVWEWCGDGYGDYQEEDQTNPHGPSSGGYRVRRGGSYYYCAWRCRVSLRSRCYPGDGYNRLGLRLVLP